MTCRISSFFLESRGFFWSAGWFCMSRSVDHWCRCPGIWGWSSSPSQTHGLSMVWDLLLCHVHWSDQLMWYHCQNSEMTFQYCHEVYRFKVCWFLFVCLFVFLHVFGEDLTKGWAGEHPDVCLSVSLLGEGYVQGCRQSITGSDRAVYMQGDSRSCCLTGHWAVSLVYWD